MADVTYRAARPEDIPAIVDVFLASLGDMYARYNITEALPPPPALPPAYKHLLSTGIFRLAELESKVAVIGGNIVRDNIWFLSTFWARRLPDYLFRGQPRQ